MTQILTKHSRWKQNDLDLLFQRFREVFKDPNSRSKAGKGSVAKTLRILSETFEYNLSSITNHYYNNYKKQWAVDILSGQSKDKIVLPPLRVVEPTMVAESINSTNSASIEEDSDRGTRFEYMDILNKLMDMDEAILSLKEQLIEKDRVIDERDALIKRMANVIAVKNITIERSERIIEAFNRLSGLVNREIDPGKMADEVFEQRRQFKMEGNGNLVTG